MASFIFPLLVSVLFSKNKNEAKKWVWKIKLCENFKSDCFRYWGSVCFKFDDFQWSGHSSRCMHFEPTKGLADLFSSECGMNFAWRTRLTAKDELILFFYVLQRPYSWREKTVFEEHWPELFPKVPEFIIAQFHTAYSQL